MRYCGGTAILVGVIGHLAPFHYRPCQALRTPVPNGRAAARKSQSDFLASGTALGNADSWGQFPLHFAVAWISHVVSSQPPIPCHRPPRSVASGCHNSPSELLPCPEDLPPPAEDLERTFKTERAGLLRYLGRRAGWDIAPDLVQEVFVRAASSQQAGRLINPAAFVRRIARNLLIDRARRKDRNNILFFPLDEQRDLASGPEQSLNLEAADLLRLYEDAVDQLPEKTRRVFLMHRVDELSYREIHERLEISIATVEYHMMKALAHIGRHVDAGQ